MDYKLYKQQYEFECVCGHIWIDSTNNGCPMCGEQEDISYQKYDSLPPENFANRTKRKE